VLGTMADALPADGRLAWLKARLARALQPGDATKGDKVAKALADADVT